MTDKPESEFRQQLKQVLQQGEQGLDPEVRARLRAARRQAVESLQRKPVLRRQGWAWAGGFAAVVYAVVLTLQLSQPVMEVSMLEDLSLLSAEEELELYQDISFYDWLEENAEHV